MRSPLPWKHRNFGIKHPSAVVDKFGELVCGSFIVSGSVIDCQNHRFIVRAVNENQELKRENRKLRRILAANKIKP